MATATALVRRAEHLLTAKGYERTKRTRLFAEEALSRKLTIVRSSALNYRTLPADFSEQCSVIDQDVQRRMSPTECAWFTSYRGAKVESLASLKEQMMGDESYSMPYLPEVIDAMMEQTRRDMERVYHLRIVE